MAADVARRSGSCSSPAAVSVRRRDAETRRSAGGRRSPGQQAPDGWLRRRRRARRAGHGGGRARRHGRGRRAVGHPGGGGDRRCGHRRRRGAGLHSRGSVDGRGGRIVGRRTGGRLRAGPAPFERDSEAASWTADLGPLVAGKTGVVSLAIVPATGAAPEGGAPGGGPPLPALAFDVRFAKPTLDAQPAAASGDESGGFDVSPEAESSSEPTFDGSESAAQPSAPVRDEVDVAVDTGSFATPDPTATDTPPPGGAQAEGGWSHRARAATRRRSSPWMIPACQRGWVRRPAVGPGRVLPTWCPPQWVCGPAPGGASSTPEPPESSSGLTTPARGLAPFSCRLLPLFGSR